MLHLRAEQTAHLGRTCGTQYCSKNWVRVEYKYADDTPVAKARYLLADASGSFKKNGVLDDAGSAYVKLPQPVVRVTVTFYDDPEVLELLQKPAPHGQAIQQDWFETIVGGIKGVGGTLWGIAKGTVEWLWGVIQGDFNEEASVSQIIAGMVLTMIPIVDQVADIRDIVAALKALIWDERYNEVGVWVQLALTLIGAIPELGSLLKGVCRAIYQGSKLGDILKVFNAFAKGNGYRWLKKLSGELATHAASITKKLLDLLQGVHGKLRQLAGSIPPAFKGFRDRVGRALEVLENVETQAAKRIKEVFDDIQRKLEDVLSRAERESTDGPSRTTVVQKQEAKAIEPEKITDTAGAVRPRREVALITPNSLPPDEQQAVLEALGHIDSKTKPGGKLGKKWGTEFKNHAGDLPGNPGAGGYREYRVAPAQGETGAGTRRIVVSDTDGSVYYTWTHYGDSGDPPFVRIR